MSRVNFIPVMMAIMALGVLASAMLHRDHRRVGVAFFSSWFVPGMGHLILGRWVKALALFGLLAIAYTTGLFLCGWRTVSFDDNPFYYVGQFGSGITLLLGQLLSSPKAFPPDHLPPGWFDGGMLYGCVAGLLNLVVMMSVFEATKPAAAPVVPPVEVRPAGEAP